MEVELYWVLKCVGSSRETAHRLDLVTLPQMLGAIVEAVENPANGIRILDAQQIKKSAF